MKKNYFLISSMGIIFSLSSCTIIKTVNSSSHDGNQVSSGSSIVDSNYSIIPSSPYSSDNIRSIFNGSSDESISSSSSSNGHYYHDILAHTSEYSSNIKESTIIYQEVIESFKFEGQYIDNYGGTFIDENGIFNICVVNEYEFIKSDYLIYKQVSYSYNYLKSIMSTLTNYMEELTIWSVGICEQCNKVTIRLKNQDKIDKTIELLNNMGFFYSDALFFIVKDDGVGWVSSN